MTLLLENILALGATVTLESVVIRALLLGRVRPSFLYILLINVLTQPAAAYAHQQLGIPVPGLELAVVVAEWVLIARLFGLSARRALVLSVVANVASASCAGPLRHLCA